MSKLFLKTDPKYLHEDTRYGIPKEDILYHVGLALRQDILEPYQALLILVANINLPAQDGVSHPLQMVALYNDDKLSISAKINKLLTVCLLQAGFTYPELQKAGLLKSQEDGGVRTLFNVLYPSPETLNPVAENQGPDQRRAGIKRREFVRGSGILTGIIDGDQVQKTYSAIPKENLLKALVTAVNANSISFEQVAMIIAVNCHSLEVRKSGQRYLDHVMSVAHDPRLNKRQKTLALLHDVLENSNYTKEDFEAVGMPKGMIASLEALSIRETIEDGVIDKEPYYAFIQRCAQNEDAAAVKIADITHNMLDAPLARRNKYEIALAYLIAVQNKQVNPEEVQVEQWAAGHIPIQLEIYRENLRQKAARAVSVQEPDADDLSFDPDGRRVMGIPALIQRIGMTR